MTTDEAGPSRSGNRRRQYALIAGGLVVALVVVGVVIALTRDDGGESRSAPATTTTTAPTSTTGAPVDTSTAVWPFASSATRYADPVAAARGFAVDFVGFTDPIVGEFRQGDSRSGEVGVQAKAGTVETTVLVRKLGDSWWVLGASTPNIQPTAPTTSQAISSPVALRGTSTAFEATVNVRVREDGKLAALGEGFVMGGGNGEMGPFDATLAFSAPTASAGSVMLYQLSAEDGRVVEATVVRVKFA